MQNLLETYQLERGLAPKPSMMMDDSTCSTILDSSGSYSGGGYNNRRYRYDHADHDDDGSASTTMMEQHDDIYYTSASSSFDDDEDDDYGDTTSVMLDDDDDTFFHFSARGRFSGYLPSGASDDSSYEDIDLLPTFNTMIIRSQSIVAENICASAIVEKEREDKRRHSQLPSVLLQKFAEARVETFARNLEYITTNFEDNTTSSGEFEPAEPSCLSTETDTTTRESAEEVVEVEVSSTRPSLVDEDRIRSPKKKEEDQFNQLSKNFNGFVQDRMDTFSRNMRFAQAQAEAWKQSFTSKDEFE